MMKRIFRQFCRKTFDKLNKTIVELYKKQLIAHCTNSLISRRQLCLSWSKLTTRRRVLSMKTNVKTLKINSRTTDDKLIVND
uniref:Uncharacterized protein n=1 Tax=Romanomermis culicivorax TaxID=13658 RepID=A0A915HRX7_ROMCU